MASVAARRTARWRWEHGMTSDAAFAFGSFEEAVWGLMHTATHEWRGSPGVHRMLLASGCRWLLPVSTGRRWLLPVSIVNSEAVAVLLLR